MIKTCFKLFMICLVFISACKNNEKDNEPTPDIEPKITGISPKEGFIGTEVTIIGENLKEVENGGKVTINGITIPVVKSEAGSLTVRIPEGAKTGIFKVTIQGKVVTSSDELVVYQLPAEGLLSFYPFTGNTQSKGSQGWPDGKAQGASLASDRFNQTNAAYQFTSSGSFVDLDDQDLFVGDNNKFAVSSWVKPTAFPTRSGKGTVIFSKISQQASQEGCNEFHQEFIVNLTVEGKVRVVYYDGDGSSNARPFRWIETTTKVLAGSWSNILINYDGSLDSKNGLDRVQVYVNGVKMNTELKDVRTSLPASINNRGAHLGIGNTLNSKGQVCMERAFEGTIDDVAFYNRLLTSTEITSIAADK